MQERAAPPRLSLWFRAPLARRRASGLPGTSPSRRGHAAASNCFQAPGLAEAEEMLKPGRGQSVTCAPGSPLVVTPRSPRFFLSKQASGMEALVLPKNTPA